VIAALGVLPGKLDHAPRDTLIAMAVLSLDKGRSTTAARVYYGGWERLAMVQGMFPNETTRRRIARHMTILQQVGIIEQLETSAPARNASWRLLLPVDNSQESVDKPP